MEHRQPSAAEVARTLLTGVGTATLGSAATQSAVPVLHAETAAGAYILVGDTHTLAGLGLDSPVSDLLYREVCPLRDLAGPGSKMRPSEQAGSTDAAAEAGSSEDSDASRCLLRYPVTLEISSMAPVADIHIERSSARYFGKITPLPAAAVPGALQAECSGVRLSEVLGYRPDAKLFAFSPERARLTDGSGRHDVEAEDVLSAVPDPLARWEGPLLRGIEDQYGPAVLDTVRALDLDTESLGIGSMGTVESVRMIGVDQYGLTLQCRWDATACIWRALLPDDAPGGCPGRTVDGAGGCHSTTAVIRLPFAGPAGTSDAVLRQVQSLVSGPVPAL